MAMIWARIVGLLFVIVGLVNIFAKDVAWQFTSFNNRLEGERSQRTGTWEIGSTIGGIVLVGAGLYLLLGV